MAIPVGTAVGYLDLDYSSFSKNLSTAITEANGLSGKFADTLGSGLTTIGDKISTMGSKLTTSITLPLGVAAGSAIKFGAEFDKGMSNVKAVSGATTEEFEMMRDAAIDWGEKTVYTATEASDALYYMGLAGWDANDSVKALGPVLNLAAAGNLELGRTSDIVTDAMTALQIEADGYTNGVANAEHFTNALAAAMANSNTDVDQMGEAFKYVAPMAGALGYSTEDLTLALGNMANVGVKASQAGTGLRQALKNLVTPANDAAAALMDELGISLFDSSGNALEFKEVMDNLRETFGNVNVDIAEMSDVLENQGEEALLNYVNGLDVTMTEQEKLQDIITIFGTRALPGILGIINATDEKYNDLANSIYNADKAFVQHNGEIMTYEEAIEQFGEELVNTSDAFDVLGYSEGMAMVQMDNLQGDWIKFTSALGTTKIEVTDLVNGALRQFVQKLTDMVKWFNDLDDEQQKHILKMLAMAAAIGPALLAFGKLISGIGRTITAFNTIGTALSKLKVGFKLVGASVTRVGEGFKLAKAGFSALGAEASPLGAALAGISAPMLAIAAVVGVLVASFVHLMKTNEEFRDKIAEIWDGIKVKFEEAGKKITNAINAIGFNFSSVTEALKAAWDWIANALAPFLTAWFESISTMIGAILNVVSGAFEIIGGLFAGFRDGDWTLFTQGIQDFFGGLYNLMAMPFIAVFNVFTEYLNAFGVTWTDIWTGVKEFFLGVWTGVTDTIKEVVDGIVEYFTGLYNSVQQTCNDIKTTVQEVWNGIKDFLINLVLGVCEAVISTWTLLKETIILIFNALSTKVQQIWTDIKITVVNIVTTVKNKVIQLWENLRQNVIQIVSQLKNNVVNLFDSLKTSVTNIVTTIRNNFVNTFTEMKTTVIAKVTEIKDGIINVFNGIREKFFEIGSNIVNGIWDGISAGWDWLTDKVKSLAQSLFDAAKSALGIHSPSRVFRDGFGYWIPLGAAEGVEKSMPLAVKEIQKSFTDGLATISGSVNIDNPLLDIIDVIQEAIDSVVIWFGSIEESLYEIVDGMKSDLMNLVEMGQTVMNPNSLVSDLISDKPAGSLKSIGGKDNQTSEVVNNYYYTFNSPKAIDEIEASRRFKETQRDLAEGF